MSNAEYDEYDEYKMSGQVINVETGVVAGGFNYTFWADDFD